MPACKTLLFCLLTFVVMPVFAAPVDSLLSPKKKLEIYHTEHPTTNLYLHIDKNIYAQNDVIWFKAYLLISEVPDSATVKNKVLYVRLVDRNKHMIVKGQFPVYDIRANGSLRIPETVKDGDYSVYAYTDRMINFSEKDVFVQHIAIKRDEVKPLEAEASVVDTTKLARGKNVRVTVRVKDGGMLAEGIKGEYQLWDGEKMLKKGPVGTNVVGEGYIDFIYPNIADERSLRVIVKLKHKNDYANVELNLPHEGNTIIVSANPEGGHLIVGQPAKIVVTATYINKIAAPLAMDLSEGNKAVIRFTTDKQGMATVNFIPKANAHYTFNYIISGIRKTVALNTPIEQSGYAIRMDKINNSQKAIIKNIADEPSSILNVRMSDTIIWSKPLHINPGDSIVASFPADQLPAGLMSVFITDTTGKLKAERLFFNKNRDYYKVRVTTDSAVYQNHQKVILSIKVEDGNGAGVAANFSVAVIEKNSLDQSRYLTINHAWDYKGLNGDEALFIKATTPKDIDQLLLTRNWVGSWQNIIQYQPRGVPRLIENAHGVTGTVIMNPGVKKFQLSNLILKMDELGVLVPLNPDHTFSISSNKLLVDQDQELRIASGSFIPKDSTQIKVISGADFRALYHIVYDIPDRQFDEKIQAGAYLNLTDAFNTLTLSKPGKEKLSFKKLTQLKEVKIHGNNKPTTENFLLDECYDYVCNANVLNCPNHVPGKKGTFGNTKAVVGEIYQYLGADVVYYGCGDYRFKTVTIPKKFNAPDYGKDKFAEPVFGTTIFWEPNSYTSTDGSNITSFYTSDLSGDYTVVIQGIDTKTLKPVYGTASFKVK